MTKSPTAAVIRRYADDFVAFCEDSTINTPTGNKRFGDIMAPFQRELIVALAPCLLAIATAHKPPRSKAWIEWTKGCAKGNIAALAIAWLSMFSRVPLVIQCGAVDKENADGQRRIFKGLLWCNGWWSKRIDVQNFRINGKALNDAPVETDILAADCVGTHGGVPANVVCLDELHAVPSGKMEYVRNLKDNQRKLNGASLLLVTTNSGVVESECYTLREEARLHPEEWLFFQHAKPAPWITEADLAESERTNPRPRHLRLFYGVWVDGSSDAITPEDLAAAFAAEVPMLNRAERGWTYWSGLDIGVRKNWTALVTIGRHAKTGRLRVANVRTWKPPRGGKVDLDDVLQAVLAEHKAFRFSRMSCDPNQCEAIVQAAAKKNVPIETRDQNGKTLVSQCMAVLDAFSSRRIDCPPHAMLEHDIRHVRLEERQYGFRLVSHVSADGSHGDTCSAMSIALGIAKDSPDRPWSSGGWAPISAGGWDVISGRSSGMGHEYDLNNRGVGPTEHLMGGGRWGR